MIRHRYLCPSRRLWILATLFILTAGASAPAPVPPPSGGSSAPTPCTRIEADKPFNMWKDCQFHPLDGFAIAGKFGVLDFSAPSGQEINDFFGKATAPTKLVGGIKIVGNDKITTLNLGQVTEWEGRPAMPDNALFIEISNNVNLATIEWQVTSFLPVKKVQILIYNNPKLSLTQAMVDTLLAQANKTSSHIQKVPTECMFSRPTDDNLYISPEQNLLDYCASIKGDLDLKDLVLKKDLTVTEPGCLRLVNVDMTKAKVKIASFTNGTVLCKNGVSSEIKNNDGLCGDDLTTLMKYFPAGSTVAVELHPSCTKRCDQSQALHQYILCQEITGDVDITPWFEPGAVDKKSKLKLATNAVLTISGGSATKLSLPLLTAAKGLEIVGNTQLKDLELPLLNTVERLKIEGNNKDLTLKKLNQLIVNVTDMDGSKVECYTEDSGVPLVISNVSQLGYCTHVIGKLVLDGLQKDVNPADVHLKEIKGCIQIENTGLSNLDFLTKANISGCSRHEMNNNPNLCESEGKRIGDVLFTSGKASGCGNTCTSLTPSCAVLNGDLVITSSTPTADFANLGIIYGSLVIDGTTHEVLEFPKLSKIHATKPPALRVTNNAQLKSLKMPKMPIIDVAANRNPAIEIRGNPHLKNLNGFLSSSTAALCSNGSATSACYYVPVLIAVANPSWYESSVGIAVLTITGALLLLIALAAGLSFYYHKIRLPAKLKKIQENRQRNKKILMEQAAKAKEFIYNGGQLGDYKPTQKLNEKEDPTRSKEDSPVVESKIKSPSSRRPRRPILRRMNAIRWDGNGYSGGNVKPGPIKPPTAKPAVRKVKTAGGPVDKTQSMTKSVVDSVTGVDSMKTKSVMTGIDSVETKTATAAPIEPEIKPKMKLRAIDRLYEIGAHRTFLDRADFPDESNGMVAFEMICTGLLAIPPVEVRRILYEQDWEILSNLFEAEDFQLDNKIYLSIDEKNEKGEYPPTDCVPSKTGSFMNHLRAQAAAVKTKLPVNIFHVGERELTECYTFKSVVEQKQKTADWRCRVEVTSKPKLTVEEEQIFDDVTYVQLKGVILDDLKNERKRPLMKDINIFNIIQDDDIEEPHFAKRATIPWICYFHKAKKMGATIHTTSPKYYFLLQMMSATARLLQEKKAYEKYGNLSSFGFFIYKRLLELYNPEAKPMDAFFMWQYSLLFMFQEFCHNDKIQPNWVHRLFNMNDTDLMLDRIRWQQHSIKKWKDRNKWNKERAAKYLVDISANNSYITKALLDAPMQLNGNNKCEISWPRVEKKPDHDPTIDPKGFVEQYSTFVAGPGEYFPRGKEAQSNSSAT